MSRERATCMPIACWDAKACYQNGRVESTFLQLSPPFSSPKEFANGLIFFQMQFFSLKMIKILF
jgi:hypothetical protein